MRFLATSTVSCTKTTRRLWQVTKIHRAGVIIYRLSLIFIMYPFSLLCRKVRMAVRNSMMGSLGIKADISRTSFRRNRLFGEIVWENAVEIRLTCLVREINKLLCGMEYGFGF